MTSRGALFRSIVALAVAASILWSCSYRFSVTASDLETLNPTFTVHRTRAFGFKLHLPGVVEIAVEDSTLPSDTSHLVWLATSDTPIAISQITYGQIPRGFRTEIGPMPLRRGPVYYLGVRAPGGGGGLRFQLTAPPGKEEAHDP